MFGRLSPVEKTSMIKICEKREDKKLRLYFRVYISQTLFFFSEDFQGKI